MDSTHGSAVSCQGSPFALGHLVGPPGYFKIILFHSILLGGNVGKEVLAGFGDSCEPPIPSEMVSSRDWRRTLEERDSGHGLACLPAEIK